MHDLIFMGMGEPEAFRCRIYDGTSGDGEAERRAFVERLADGGVLDSPAYDRWVEALQARGWLPAAPELEPNPDGPGKVGRWHLTARGREEWERIKERG